MVFAKGQSGNPDKIFKKGVVTNPKGKTPGKNHKTILAELLKLTLNDKDLNNKPINVDVATALGLSLIKRGLATGDYKTIEYIMNTVEGNLPKDTELSDVQKMIVQRAFQRITEMKDVTK